MPRYKLTLEYDGSAFVGWQRQAEGASVQGALEAAVEAFRQVRVTAVAAGRTDSGVHALGQVAHVDLPDAQPPETVRKALNAHLRPAPVAVVEAVPVADTFHARFSAVERAYRYRVLNRPGPPVLDRGRVWWEPRPLDTAAMAEAAAGLTGRHDFSTFRASICQAGSPVKTLDVLDVTGAGEEIHITARARSFLHHQVRILAGTLVRVGLGRWTPADVRAALEARDRRAGGPTAPAHGLYFTGVAFAPGAETGTDGGSET